MDDHETLKALGPAVGAAVGSIFTFLGLWFLSGRQWSRDYKDRLGRETREREERVQREIRERAERRHREFRIAVAAWASAAFETAEAQRAYLDKLEELIEEADDTHPLMIDYRRIGPYSDLVRRTRLAIKQASFLAEVHAPTLELQRQVRSLTKAADLPSYSALPEASADPAALLGEKQTLEQQQAFLQRIHGFMEQLPG